MNNKKTLIIGNFFLLFSIVIFSSGEYREPNIKSVLSGEDIENPMYFSREKARDFWSSYTFLNYNTGQKETCYSYVEGTKCVNYQHGKFLLKKALIQSRNLRLVKESYRRYFIAKRINKCAKRINKCAKRINKCAKRYLERNAREKAHQDEINRLLELERNAREKAHQAEIDRLDYQRNLHNEEFAKIQREILTNPEDEQVKCCHLL